MNNEFSVDLYFTQHWLDPRLQNVLPADMKKLRIRGSMVQQLWLPDTIIRNSGDSKHPDAFQHNADNAVVLHKDGNIYYTSRISAICFCRMDLSLYPFDEQRCLVHFEALSYQEDELVYVDPHAHLAPNATLPTRFSLTIQPVNSSSQKYHGGEHYSSFSLRIDFLRISFPVVLRSFLPAALIVLSSWVGFFIQHDKAPARVALSITSFLALVTLKLFKGQSDELYTTVTADDIYHFGCITFVFFTLLEFACVQYCHTKEVAIPQCYTTLKSIVSRWFRSLIMMKCIPRKYDASQASGGHGSDINLVPVERSQNSCVATEQPNQTDQENSHAGELEEHSTRDRVEKESAVSTVTPPLAVYSEIDKVFQVLFPVLFGFFNLIYWSIWSSKSVGL
jgi:hypothetical protein